MRDVIDEMISIRDVLPKKQKLLCNYILLNHAKVGVMTVAELANNAGVGTTTVMRLLQILKYDSFSTFKKDVLNNSIMQEGSSYRNKKQTFSKTTKGMRQSTLSNVTEDIARSMENFLTSNNFEQFEKAIELFLAAEHIYVLGMRSSRVAALYFEFALNGFYSKVRQLSNEQEYLYDRLLQIGEGDVLLAISQWPCTKKTIDVANVCNQKHVPTVLITNTTINPIARFAEVVLDTNSVGNASEITPIIAMIEALVVELGRRTAPQSTENLESLEQLLKENNLIIWDQ
ncbi:MurR/RpiR family transcriptional regulator [Oscillospiraceae bacterium LTW-04]|nr:MurR/RpiR family transcriptional regulator [Oscillospiraceae bacterium MB24-C1]